MRFSDMTAAIDEAMAKARGEFLPIDKERTADTGTFKYDYADLADIFEATTAALSKHGLILISDVWVKNEPALASCSQSWIRHSSGQWYESSVLERPTTVNGKMGPAQLLGSAQSYGRRYQVLGILGIQPRREDDDGHAASDTGGTTAARSPHPNAPKCPQCNKPMARRKGRDGEFWGCKGYPECKGTRPIEATPEAVDQQRQAQSGEENQAGDDAKKPREKPNKVYEAVRTRLHEIGCKNADEANAVLRFVVGQDANGGYKWATLEHVRQDAGAPAAVILKLGEAKRCGMPDSQILHDALEQAGLLEGAQA